MAILLNLALFCIFGALQASCQQLPKSIEVVAVTKELKCCDGIQKLYEYISKTGLKAVKEGIEVKLATIPVLVEVLGPLSKAGCGKEIEEKKNQEEVIEALKKITERVLKVDEVSKRAFEEELALSNLFSFALNDLRCSCKNDVCVKKIEYPEKKVKEIKECKEGKCNKRLKGVVEYLPEYIAELEVIAQMYQYGYQCIEYMLKFKEDILKDEEDMLMSLIG